MIGTQRLLPRTALALAVGVAALASARTALPAGLPQVITVEASYPGANAQVVAETVAAPIEQQVNGVERLPHLWSRSASDGSYRLTLAFLPGTDPNMAQVLVQNRVSLAQPTLPNVVTQLAITVKKGWPSPLAIACLSSPENRYDTLYLSNYATIQIKDELARVPGVADLTLLGQQDYGLRVWLDPDKLAARGLTASDVTAALQNQNAAAEAGRPPAAPGQGPTLTVTTHGRLTDPDQLADVIVKTDGAGRVVRLRDVARVELGAGRRGAAGLDGRPVVALAVYPLAPDRPREVVAALRRKLDELRERLPEGLRLDLAFDFAPNWESPARASNPEYFLLDVDLPAGASAERTAEALQRCGAVVRQVPGVRTVLALSDQPFDRDPGRPCLLVGLAPAGGERAGREQIARGIRSALRQSEARAAVRLRDLSGPGGFPRCGYPIDLAVSGAEPDRVRELADRLAERLVRSGAVTDVWAGPKPAPQLYLDIDRTKASALGVAAGDITTTLQTYLGPAYVNDFNAFGRTWQVTVQTGDRSRTNLDGLRRLQVRNNQGQMVRLGTIVSVRDTLGPTVFDRLDLLPAVPVTANPAGVSLAEARSVCERLAEEARKELRLPADYRLTWLREMPAAKPLPRPPEPPAPAPPPAVAVSQPVQRQVAEYAEFTGRLEAAQSVDLRARVSGYLVRVAPESDTVKQGDLLFEIDPRPYQAEADKADAELRLREAQLRLATANLDRLRALAARGGAGQDDLDRAQADRVSAEAALQVAKATRQVVRLNLDFTRVTAPIGGRVSRPLVSAGNLVVADQTTLATIVSLDPIYVTFDMDERTLLRLRRLQGEGQAAGAAGTPVFVGLADEQGYPHKGQFASEDIRVDPGTGTLRCRAVLPNPKGLLLPGLFVRVRLTVAPPAPALLVPERAVGTDQGQAYVLVVTDRNVTERRPVRLGPVENGWRVVREGLAPGDWVVTDNPRTVGARETVEPRRGRAEPDR
jgi:RND family efflux transporter MFP subunit